MTMQKWERVIELSIIGVVLFIGLVSILYSWIDGAIGGIVNVYVLTAIAAVLSFLIVYAIKVFDKG